jgi:hypothetical protein
MNQMKLAVVGSRSFQDKKRLFRVLDQINKVKKISLIVSGGALGADSLSEEWAKDHQVEFLMFKPEWQKYGKRAGFLRNQLIVEHADAVVAFWDGQSRGTKHSMNLTNEANKPLLIIRP